MSRPQMKFMAASLERVLQSPARRAQVAAVDRFLAAHGYRPTIARTKQKRWALRQVTFR
jgi:hypothetical protein